MFVCMRFLNRHDELTRLDGLVRQKGGGLAVVSGRRRVGKTRLLLEWTRRHDGVYFVADQSTPALQRAALANALSGRLPGFAEVTYPNWGTLFARLSADLGRRSFRGPLVLDELPYLVATSPELPSVLQAWVDHDVPRMGLAVALAGSSQRMMQGLVLDASTPLYGRAAVMLEVRPLTPAWVAQAFPALGTWDRLLLWATLGGVPRYWELLAAERGPLPARLERLALDPLGPLHHEPDRLLLEEDPPAMDLRPLLEAIGAGAHRVTEIAARIGRPATALSRALERLVGLGLVLREVPFGENPRGTRRSLYRLADPFMRLWFRLVAPHRGTMASSSSAQRLALLDVALPHLVAQGWEALARDCVTTLGAAGRFGRGLTWLPASRWWQGNAPEWDVVSTTTDDGVMLVGEVKARARPLSAEAVRVEVAALKRRPPPPVRSHATRVERVLFVPRVAASVRPVVDGVHLVTAADVLAAHSRKAP